MVSMQLTKSGMVHTSGCFFWMRAPNRAMMMIGRPAGWRQASGGRVAVLLALLNRGQRRDATRAQHAGAWPAPQRTECTAWHATAPWRPRTAGSASSVRSTVHTYYQRRNRCAYATILNAPDAKAYMTRPTMPVYTANEGGAVMHQAPTAEAKNDQAIRHLPAVPRPVMNCSAVWSWC